jgi:hypothetical protein
MLERIEIRVPEFGGAFEDDVGFYDVYLTDIAKAQVAEKVIRSELPQPWRRKYRMRFLLAKYRYVQLRQARDFFSVKVPEIAIVGVDLKCNRVRVQAAAPQYLPTIQRWLQGHAFRDRYLYNVAGDAKSTDCTPPLWPPRQDSACISWRRATGATERPSPYPALTRYVPELGGAFVDSGIFKVYLTDLKRKPDAQPYAECDQKLSHLDRSPVRYLQGQYTITQLENAKDHLPPLGKGLTALGVDHRRNRVHIYAASQDDIERMKGILKANGLAVDMFVFDIMGPARVL